MSGVSPVYGVPWPVLLTAFAAVVILCLACYLAGYAEGEHAGGREERGRASGGEEDDRGNWRW